MPRTPGPPLESHMTQPATWALVLVVANGFMDAGLAWADPGPRAPRLLARGVSAQALYSFSRAGELLAHYAVDGHAHSDVSPDSQARLEDMVAAVADALRLRRGSAWPGLVRRVMELDRGWDGPAARYEEVYRGMGAR